MNGFEKEVAHCLCTELYGSAAARGKTAFVCETPPVHPFASIIH